MPCKKRWGEAREGKKGWKAEYFRKLIDAMRTYSRFLLISADNVSSKQFADIRRAIRGEGLIVMGKNTMMKKVIRNNIKEFSDYEKVLPLLVGNVGFLFTNGDLPAMRDIVKEYKVAAPARAGAKCDVEVIIEPQNTGMGPEKTSFFQSLQIQTRIARGTIEIVNPVPILKPGDIVGASEATLLNMLKISPFTYGLVVEHCYDQGSLFEPSVMDITPDDILARFMTGVNNVAAVSLNIGYPTLASVPHSMANAFKNLLAVAVGSDNIGFKEAEAMKDRLANPDAYVVVTQVAAVDTKPEAAAAVADGDDDDDDDSVGSFNLFGDEESSD